MTQITDEMVEAAAEAIELCEVPHSSEHLARAALTAALSTPPRSHAAGVTEDEVTDEMIAAGSEAIDDYYNGTKDAPFEGSVAACYRAMRALASRPAPSDVIKRAIDYGEATADIAGTLLILRGEPFPTAPTEAASRPAPSEEVVTLAANIIRDYYHGEYENARMAANAVIALLTDREIKPEIGRTSDSKEAQS